MKVRNNFPPEYPYNNNKNFYDDDNIPEIDLPKTTDDTNIIPDEVSRQNESSGE